ncbi:unnamed protein product [Adineta steineri]|uniref:EF-hand domain-containing protein n=1 Tax=Adineta steineri TaxID=433720 RepID=A0A815R037_9BILA|nr:unnamed protein product [Adineta steineri]CAF1635665.1 unnamed protein product [Adineta steineri]
MKNLFRSRLPLPLTVAQITRLSIQSRLALEEIEDWYDRFVVCYPYGYISFKEFQIYLKQLNIYNGHEQYQISKLIIKQMFYILNKNQSKKLNFEEFFQFNLLINQESEENKLKFIFKLYDRQTKIYYNQKEIQSILIHLFNLLNISRGSHEIIQIIDTILIHLHLNNQNIKICWNTFCKTVLNKPFLFKLLLSSNNDNFDEILVTRL